MNKTILAILWMAFCALPMQAQEVVDFSADGPLAPDGVERRQQADGRLLSPDTCVAVAPVAARYGPLLPPLTARGTIGTVPFYGGFFTGYQNWALHSGLNASLSASAIIGAGRHGGSGFANTVSLMYADTLTSRLSYAVGGYYSRLDWRGMNTSDAGLTALLNYQIDDHWEATLFAQKSLVQPKMPMPLFLREDIGDKIGAEVRYHFNPSFSIGLSVWHQSSDADYPMPRSPWPRP